MRYSAAILLTLMGALMVMTCDKSTDSKGNSIFGKWILHNTESIEYYDGVKYMWES